ncbi:ABC transporter ATP-binding protein [Paenibacillus sp.]|uniref:ABC transporter ATP-binding protein n=1 Tax=Paenibacillus sp. TaxID=58172 RepID=UPI00281178B1|nr:ABC transporter ATP-binding protein [Paenibacillus sp.]
MHQPPKSNDAPRNDERTVSLWTVYLWCLSYLRPYLSLLLLLLASMSVISAAELLVPKFVQLFIDDVLPHSNRALFYRLLLGLVAVLAIVIVVGMAQNLIRRQLQEKTSRDVQYAMVQHLRRLGFAYYEQHPVGQTLAFLNTEVASLQNLYRNQFPWFVQGLIFSLFSVAIMVATSPRLSLIVLPCFLLYYIFGPMLERNASLSGKRMAEHRVEENRKAYESVSAIAELRAFSAERWDLGRYVQKLNTSNASMIRTYWYAYLRGTNRRITYNIGGVAIFIYGFHLLQTGGITVGNFVSFLLYYFTAMHRLTAVVTNVTEQKVLMYQAERLYRFAKLRPQVEEAERPTPLVRVEGRIRFENVSFAYPGQRNVLQGLTLDVRAGERLAIVGASGNGKSTLLKLVGRFYDPTEGRITLDDVPLRELSFETLRGALGYVFQDTYIFGSTVKENIRFGKPDATDEEVEAAAAAAFAHEFISALPDGYDTIVGERGVKLSGGQKQRIAIARMIVHDPAIVLLDEATSALDNVSEAEVQKVFETFLVGRTVIAVAHRLSTVRDFDRIAVIEDGRVAEIGGYEELMQRRGAFYRLASGTETKEIAAHG